MRIAVCILIQISMFFMLKAQERYYTLNQYVPLLYSPAYSTLDYDASISFFHEQYTISSSDAISTSFLNAEYPIINKTTGEKIIGIGLNFGIKDYGQSDLLKTFNAGFSLARSARLSDRHWLSLGVSADYLNKRTSLDQITTGSQWIPDEFRYDPGAAIGESFNQTNVHLLSLGTGVVWQLMDKGMAHSFLAVSAYNLNRPAENFFEEETRLPVAMVVNGGTVVYQGARVIVAPRAFYSHINGRNNYRMLLSTKFLFTNERPYGLFKTGDIDLLINYGFRQDLALGIVLNQPGFSAGFAYTLATTRDEATYLQNGYEFGVRLTKTLWRKRPDVINIEPVDREASYDIYDRQGSTNLPPTEIAKISNLVEQLPEDTTLQFHLQKDFAFDYGESNLDLRATRFLDDLAVFMQEHQDSKVRVIGHTDDMGSNEANYQLSLERARVVAEYLQLEGLDPELIEFLGKGDADPLVPQTDEEEEKAENRRVEFFILLNQE